MKETPNKQRVMFVNFKKLDMDTKIKLNISCSYLIGNNLGILENQTA